MHLLFFLCFVNFCANMVLANHVPTELLLLLRKDLVHPNYRISFRDESRVINWINSEAKNLEQKSTRVVDNLWPRLAQIILRHIWEYRIKYAKDRLFFRKHRNRTTTPQWLNKHEQSGRLVG